LIQSKAPLGAYLTRQEAKTSYAIIRHNIRTYISAGVVQVVRGQQNAALAMRHFEDGQASDDRQNGWRYFLEETELAPGMDPEQATQQRWMEFEARESKAMDQVHQQLPRRD
jgi:hypothetical protein